jgi:hypothetical protein
MVASARTAERPGVPIGKSRSKCQFNAQTPETGDWSRRLVGPKSDEGGSDPSRRSQTEAEAKTDDVQHLQLPADFLQPIPRQRVADSQTTWPTAKIHRANAARWLKDSRFPISNLGNQYSDIRAALKLRQKHQEITSLMKSMAAHGFPPSTFDGAIPEFAFSEDKSQGRLIIGNKYRLPDGKGREIVGELQHAVVMESIKSPRP